MLVSGDQSRLRRASQLVFSHALVRAGQQPYAASQIKSWRSVDNATLSRLTWLWLAYGAFALVAGQRRLPSVCPFRLLTGHRCPLCGLTRSLNYFMRGKIPSSFREHPVGPILIVGSGFLFASAWRSRLATAWYYSRCFTLSADRRAVGDLRARFRAGRSAADVTVCDGGQGRPARYWNCTGVI